MSLSKTVLAPLFASLLVVGVSAQEVAVSGKEIQEKWVDKDLLGSTASGGKVFMKLQSDGKASVSAGSVSDTGTWRAAENGYCTTWKTIRAGQERCYTVTRGVGAVKVLNPDGSLSGYFHNAP